MKNFTNNFKQFTSRLGARWIIIALMMLVGTSSAWGATITSDGNSRLYFNSTAVSWWPAGNNCDGNFAYFFNNSTDKSAWSTHAVIDSYNQIYYFVIPAGEWENVILTRNNTSTSPSWNNKWNQTGDITLSSSSNYISKFSEGSTSVTWGECQGIPGVTIQDVSPICSGSTATLSASCDQGYTKINWYDVETGGTSLKEGASYTTAALTSNKTYYASATNGMCTTPRASKSVTVRDTPTKYTVSKGSADNKVKLSNSQTNYTYTLYNDGVAVSNSNKAGKTGSELEWTLSEDGTYTVKARYTGSTCTLTQMTGSYEYISCTPVQSSHYTISDAEYTYDGTAKKPTVTANTADAGDPTSIEYKQGNTTVANPINVGEYDVYVTSNNGTTYCGASDLKVGSFEIKCTEDITKDKFSYTLPANAKYTGNPHAVSVNWENGTTQTNGDITVYYKKGEGEYINEAPTLAGSYTVAAKVTTAGNYCESKNYVELGQFEISLAEQEDFDNTTSPSVCGATTTLSATGGSGKGSITYEIGATNTAYASIVNTTTLMANNSGSVEIIATKAGEEGKYKPISSTKTITFTILEAPFNGVAQSTTICAGSPFNYDAAYIWYTSESGNQTVYGSATLNATTEYYISQTINGCESARTKYTVNVDTKPKVVLTTNEVESICQGDEINLEGYIEEHSGTIKWYSDSEYNTEITELIFTPNTQQTYYVKATNGVCEPATASLSIKVIAKPTIPTFDTVDPQCGSYILPINDKGGLPIKWYETMESVTPLSDNTTVTASGTYYYYAEGVNGNCVSDSRTAVEVTINATPTITAPTATQTNKEITLTSAAGASTQWSVSPLENVTLTDNGDGTATFVATANGDYTITASNGVCAPVSHTIKVSDAFYIWVRNAKESDTAYGQFYYPNENSEAVRGGAMFYAECDALPTTGNYTTYNRGGRKADIVNDDCDGYTWYGFKASADVIAGTKYFYVHATNDLSDGGYYTHSKPLKSALSGDVYYTLGTTGDSFRGWNLSTAPAPYSGPKVHASDDAKFNANNFADFVSLYVTDCSGNEVIGYQWSYTAPTCTYIGKETVTMSASTSNNIRVREAGNYTCTVTYKDGTTATSPALTVSTGATNTPALAEFTSNLPIIMVNTNGVGFPDCTGLSGQTASKNASTLKEKRSVDVIIKDGNNIIYDRKARMNYRGSSSLNFVKKSYAFCPGEADCVEDKGRRDYVKTAKLNMLGLGEAYDKDWVLYAAAADPSLMRNRLVFDSYAAMTGEWGVQSRYVELIVDGVYKGVYVFMDKITMNKKRVKVDEDKGFIVKFDKTDKEDRVGGLNGVFGDEKTFKTSYTGKDDIGTYDTSIDQRFEIEYPEKDDYPTGWSAKVNQIQGMFQAFEDALKAGDYATVQKYIDYTSWADWFIINEFTKNVDAYRASCIFVYTGEAGAKIEARPLWDQELSFNNQASLGTNNKGCNSTTGLLIQHSNVYSDAFKAPFWFTGGGSDITGGLLSDPCFVQVVKERWNMHQFGALSKKSLEDLVDEYEDDLAPEGTTENALKRETTFWDGKSRGTCDCSYETSNATATGYQNKTFAESTGTITNWISDAAASSATGRRAGLTTAINGLTGASFSIQIMPNEAKTTPWEPVEIAVSVTPTGYDYKLEYTDNDLGSVANTIIEEEGDKITYRIPRPDDWGTGDESVEGQRTDIEYGIKATLNVQDGTTVCGSQAAPTSTAKIILQDEENENCQ